MVDASTILASVLTTYSDHPKWENAPFGNIRSVPNTKVGDVGQDFVEKLCEELGLKTEFPENKKGKRKRQSPWDIRIEGTTFEIKTASEDISGSFQFNHIRYHRHYDALLCIGIAPANIYVGAWSKADITTGKAGNLVTMERQGNASYKLTKTPGQLKPITEFYDQILSLVTNPNV